MNEPEPKMPPPLPKASVPHATRARSGRRLKVAIIILAPIVILIVPAIMLLIRATVITSYKVSSAAMSPTLIGAMRSASGERSGTPDHFFVNRLAYLQHEPRRGDVIVFKTGQIPGIRTDTVFVFRVVALPGETVSIHPPNLLINGAVVNEPGIFEAIQNRERGFAGYVSASSHTGSGMTPCLPSTNQFTVREDSYFVLGDNSGSSFDSRYWGPVPRDAIIGRATRIYWPLSRRGRIE